MSVLARLFGGEVTCFVCRWSWTAIAPRGRAVPHQGMRYFCSDACELEYVREHRAAS
jgi:hypothetical protein